jgi:opacity protein-like surface antigen
MDYLEVPVLLRVNTASFNAGGLTVYGVAGPAFGVQLRSTLDSGDSLTDEITRTDVGLAVGAGADWAHLRIEARYTRGMKNIGTETLDLGGTLKSHAFAILVGWRLK